MSKLAWPQLNFEINPMEWKKKNIKRLRKTGKEMKKKIIIVLRIVTFWLIIQI